MAERTRRDQDVARDEVDSLTGGPGVVATKSQAQGALAGILVGAIVGAIIGGVIGLIANFLIVGLLVGAVGGAVVAGVAGGGQRPKQRLEGSEADR
jgi:predicted lipid-binding transport protein (Tim44 family)